MHAMAIAAFIVGSVYVAWVGSYRYVEMLTRCIYVVLLTRPLLRLALAAMFAIATALMGAHVATAAARFGALRVLSRRNAGKSSWKSTVSKVT